MYKLEIKLKQHTPLIHFQHDQDGATLRASEVKPKLDKFILNKLSLEEKKKGRNEGWIKVKDNKMWLDYKMSIEAVGKPQEYFVTSLFSPINIIDSKNEKIDKGALPFQILGCTPFFAQETINCSNNKDDSPVFFRKRNNQGKYDYIFNADSWESIEKKGLMWNGIHIILFSFHDDLISIIDAFLTDFFICTNFGARSSKGFGSFTREEGDKKVSDHLKSNYTFVYSKDCRKYDLNSIFKIVKEDYQKLKSGINHNGYTKSLLFCYAVQKMQNNPRWEKRFFKKATKKTLGPNKRLLGQNSPIYDYKGNMSWEDQQEYDYRYLRAVLGMAEEYGFLLEQSINGYWKRDNEKLVVKPKCKDEKIERYKSPLLIKIIDGVIYIVGNEVDQRLLGKEFSINYSIGQNNLGVSEEYCTIKTPDSFSLSDFMSFAMSSDFNLGYKKIK